MSTSRRPIERPVSVSGVVRESVRDILKDIARKRFTEIAGIVLVAIVIALTLALVSWSVRDPSFNHAVDGPVRNWLGPFGAVVSDIAIQLFGIGILAVMFPILLWGLTLVKHRGVDRFPLRLASFVIGVFSASAFASLLPRADSWPLPTGLGGAVGDGIERLPLLILGSGGLAKMTVALVFLAVAIIALHFSVVRDRRNQQDEHDEDSRSRRHSDLDEDEFRDDEPSRALVVVGAAIHGVMAVSRAVARSARSLKSGAGRKIANGTRQMVEKATRDDQTAYAMAGSASQPAGMAYPGQRREPVMQREPVVMRETMSELSAPVYRRGVAAAESNAAIPAIPKAVPAVHAPASQATGETAQSAGYGAAVMALQMAAKRRLGLLKEAPAQLQPAVIATGSDNARPGERAAIEALQMAARRRLGVQHPQPVFEEEPMQDAVVHEAAAAPAPAARGTGRVSQPAVPVKLGKRETRESQPDLLGRDTYELPPLSLLNEAKRNTVITISEDALEQNARLLEGVLEDFGVKGEIINVRPGPVVTLYELEPAPGTKSSRVIGLADDIARSMSAISARVAVVPGRNVIGIELPNQRRETVYFRELIGSQDFEKSPHKLALSLGKNIGGEPIIAELAKMPHLLVAGTTGSGKSVAINTMILSLLYRLRPDQCRLIMIDPKMLELSVYDGIPHLLTPVVTDPKKAVVALKWAVREMEDRYKKMSKVGVRNIDGFNARVAEARASGEVITRTVQTGFDKETGEILYAQEDMPLDVLPYIVVLIDEMADLMMVAGKDIEGAVQRLAQMARAAGIHVIMATQRPSVDVITGTIKANFPTRISFQVTSKIDSRTILGEMGAEQLLGQGDMLHMAGGGRISRVHGPFVSDEEVERVVHHLKRQGKPQYLDAITRDDEEEVGEEAEDGAVFDKGEFGEEGGDLYDQAVRIVIRDKKASTSYIQRRLQIGYNRAASLMERMEKEGVVGAANHAGKREILVEGEE
ncbi:MAG: DNA translocase FtsK 4TM domain-containing protein [Beijerinckiaceae bacterium]